MKTGLKHVPGVLALGAVCLYVVGVIRNAGRFDAAGISPIDAFPLVPLERHFVTGLGVIVDAETVKTAGLALLTAMLISVLNWDSARGFSPTAETGRGAGDTPPSRSALATSTIAFVVLLLISPWYFLPIVVFGLAIVSGLGIAQRHLERTVWSFTTRYLVGGVLTLIVVLGVRAYFFAPPPATVDIRLKDGGVMSGWLVGTQGSDMLVATPAPSLYSVVPSSTVQRATVSANRKYRDRGRTWLDLAGLGGPGK